MNLGENIYKFRTSKNMSQGDLADALEVSRQSVSKWETGTAVPELDKLIKMSDLFGVSLDVLVGRSSPQTTSPAPPAATEVAPQGVSSGDLVSILILLFALLIPIVIIATSELHDSTFLLVFGMFILPPAATICAAHCSPHNTVLYRAFMVYDIIFGLIAAIMANVLAPIIVIIYIFAVGYWSDKREGH